MYSANVDDTLTVTYLLDATGESARIHSGCYTTKSETDLGHEWDKNVRDFAIQITLGILSLKRRGTHVNSLHTDFLEGRALPDPLSVSDVARDMLSIAPKSVKSVVFHKMSLSFNNDMYIARQMCSKRGVKPSALFVL